MPAAARQGDPGVTHCSSYTIATGSPDVRINGRPAARVGDSSTRHLRPGLICPPHTAKINSGAATVHINGFPAARVGSTLAMCTRVAAGSADVEIGGPSTGGGSGYGLQAAGVVAGAAISSALGF